MKNTAAETETLFCESGQHEFTRERKRGVKPKICPQHKAEREQAAAAERAETVAENTITVDPAEIARVMAETEQSEYVVTALLAGDVTVPRREVTDRVGFDIDARKAFDKYAEKAQTKDEFDRELDAVGSLDK